MRPEQLEQLHYEDESSALDFKRDKYTFAKPSEEEKSELLKDILGFVNCWRRSEGFILIGVEDVQGRRSIVHGVSEPLPNHYLQQFVNCLTNRSVQFGYEACAFEGKQVDVRRIESQRRPIFLKRVFDKLKKGEVYMRRGTSTDPTKPADPDEIVQMGSDEALGTGDAPLAVEFAVPDRERCLGNQIAWYAEFCKMPESDEIPTLSDRPAPIRLPRGQAFHIPSVSSFDPHERLNSRFYHGLANYFYFCKLFKKIRLVVVNPGDAPATDVRLEMSVQKGQVFGIVEWLEVPKAPKRRDSIVAFPPIEKLELRPAFRHAGDVDIEKNECETKVEIECGNLQPGRKVSTDAFHLRIGQSGAVQITGSVFAANLPQPKTFNLSITADIQQTTMTVDELGSLGDQSEDTEDDE